MSQLYDAIKAIKQGMPSLSLWEKEPMSRHCSFRIGGPVDALIQPQNEEEIIALFQLLHTWEIVPLVIGNGTNLLVTDAPLHRIVVKLGEGFQAVQKIAPQVLSAQAGASLARLATVAMESGLQGLSFAHGIPGSVGGGLSMNAGAYGGEMKDVVSSVTYLDTAEGKVKKILGNACNFSYRHSMFSDNDFVILGCEVTLQSGVPEEIHAEMRELIQKRRQSQPLNKPSAGSTFKRPQQGYAAAMIDACNLRGYTVGGAQVSEKHAGFIINAGNATFADVRALMAHVQETVEKQFGVCLEPEVKIIEA